MIPKGQKNYNFKYRSQYDEEYNILAANLDYDEKHRKNLDNKYGDFCRYSDISTYSHTRVQIDTKSTYINASWINIPKEHNIISTQGPIKNTIEDFWTMIDQYDIKIIVMLCNLVEGGYSKCENYWEFGKMKKYKIEFEKESEKKEGNFLKIRKFKLINLKNQKIKEVSQLHFIGWPDHGVPNIIDTYSTFIRMIDYINKNKDDKPIVVHCSAGVGRTGTFIAIYLLYQEIMEQINDKNKKEIKFSVFNIVRKMKEMRMLLVQNASQYLFVYNFIDCLLESNNI